MISSVEAQNTTQGLEHGVLSGPTLPGAGCDNAIEVDADADLTFFGPSSATIEPLIVAQKPQTWSFVRMGFTPSTNILCQQPLSTPCSLNFLAVKLQGQVFAYPNVSVIQTNVTQGCEISKCQGLSGTISDGKMTGTAYSRGSSNSSYTVSATPNTEAGVTNITNAVIFTIVPANAPIECDVIYQLNGGTVADFFAASPPPAPGPAPPSSAMPPSLGAFAPMVVTMTMAMLLV